MLLIKGGNIIGALEEGVDILIEDGKIVEIRKNIKQTADMNILNAEGFVVAPGLVDVHVHFREPGFEYKEDILTGAAAAAAGGVTTCLCMPNTSPVADNAETISYIANKAKEAPVTVLPIGAITVGLGGKELTDFSKLAGAGAVALSDDGNPIQNAKLVRTAMKKAKEIGLIIISHCEDDEIAQNYAVNEGAVSRALGIPGRPAIAEEIMVARDILLARETGAKVHIAHVSTAASVAMIRAAKAQGIAVTAETCPQYFSLTEEEVLRQGTLARVNPPLRTEADVAGIIEGLSDKTIDIIATDHAPHAKEEKAQSIEDAPSGLIGLETSLALALTNLYHTKRLSIKEIIELMATNPARIFGLRAGSLRIGAIADIVIFDPSEQWCVSPEQLKSKAVNTPFGGMQLYGRVKYTISRGRVVYKD
ncbi:MAG: dihydroorotase [Oscillospiraceae bacterium]|nr:dihydroorotase [Oscillospiraceae bacterium]